MSYTTTKVQALKSYPTYQFYAKADSKTVGVNDVLKICILETLRWIRARLEGHNELPEELDTPEPEQYADFKDDMLTSFSYNSGFQIDVIFIDTLGVWSFRITEPDMGANIGTPNERPAVNGRTFTTEISFRKNETDVEIGIKTICSEPADNTTDCEVFRPRVVRALAENRDLRIIHSGWILNGDSLEIRSKNDLEMFSQDSFTAYNTTCEFRDGQLIRVISSSYPQGPEEYTEDEPKPVPVWKFCHGLRDGLDTAVITGYSTDCEEGSSKIDMTPEEIEKIRSLAVNGMVTGKASDESVTGGTWVYSFETPGGKHLLSVELYKGMIVAADGMYQYQK